MEQPAGDIRKAAWFVILTYALSWGALGLYLTLGGTLSFPWNGLVGGLYMFFPMTIAFVLQRVYGQPIAGPLGISFRPNRWWLVAWLTMPVLALATVAASLLLPGVHYDPSMTGILERFRWMLTPEQYQEGLRQIRTLPIFWLTLLSGMVAGITINALFAFGEETGWRGFLQRELAPLGFWRSSILIGIIWGIWHFPLILQGWNYPQHRVFGMLMMTVWTTLLTPLFVLVRLRGKSVIAPSILHGTMNGVAGAALMPIRGGTDLMVGLTGLAGFIVLAIVNSAIYLYLRAYPISDERLPS